MIYSLTINIDRERISILSDEGSCLTEIPNIVALDDEDKLAGIGGLADELQKRVPQEWEQVIDKIRFTTIFSTFDEFHISHRVES